MPPPRQGRDSEAESAGEGYAYVVETEVHRPHPFLVSRSRAPSLSGGWTIFPSGCEGKLGVALESLQGLRDLT